MIELEYSQFADHISSVLRKRSTNGPLEADETTKDLSWEIFAATRPQIWRRSYRMLDPGNPNRWQIFSKINR